jgi:hypothetical protein
LLPDTTQKASLIPVLNLATVNPTLSQAKLGSCKAVEEGFEPSCIPYGLFVTTVMFIYSSSAKSLPPSVLPWRMLETATPAAKESHM